jgi:hypothetical protein
MPLANPGNWSTVTDSARGTNGFVPDWAGLAYDSAQDRVLLAGDYDGDVYALSLQTEGPWTPITATGTAPPSLRGRLRYDVAGDRAIFVDRTYEVWQLTLSGTPSWTRIDAGPAPSLNSDAPTILDTGHDQLVVLSGSQFWVLPLVPGSAWTQLQPAGLPNPTFGVDLGVYDPIESRMVLCGPTDDGLQGQVLALTLNPPQTLTRLSQGGIPASALNFADGAYDPVRDQVVVFGASTVWTFPLRPDVPTAVLASVVEADAGEGRVHVRWHVEGSGQITIERHDVDQDWHPIASLAPDGTGSAEYTDTSVRQGQRYGYRVRPTLGVSAPAGEVWLEVPAPSLWLAGAESNPTVGPLRVRFILPDAAYAVLELLDVSGRRIASQDIGALGPGEHSVVLSNGRPPAPGVYLIRLVHGRSVQTARVAVLR